ncbi:bifunctional [glutamine synthetase] adenylyltransferase/[glutamine synthetase]-adenylyl-L-tyrosine phosphorylase [Gulosibacter molinativorax]|uniref:Bifunctional glutamine-synthetase adenylyltransferase/deadenyltransferase n=1 Tax=Gulosibacter molinativorax TaxID=256821 RepID=A0ABT7C523_9MICO|nr:bifunctional [glutamine synthetase] adenylyltransferase/[glutamine synthetase]-adenylyl-L-tyrosine phosphorylase [Gulosibacter molinativorax]MDJ1370298.1 bifunctional glutamine-synthetase adenylyltransferase/deadenyltransferase [Gulosibacter molinativorax]QUY61718.1 Glutamate-ammonia-ligase adenylyltransferase [Gulosibacter molinativorax]
MREGIRTRLIRVGFSKPLAAADRFEELSGILGIDPVTLVSYFEPIDPDPDGALESLLRLVHRQPSYGPVLKNDPDLFRTVITLFAISTSSEGFFIRHPERLREVHEDSHLLASPETLQERLRKSVAAQIEPESGQLLAGMTGDEAANALRVVYRTELGKIALYDARLEDAQVSLHRVAAALSDLAGAALDAAVAVARAEIAAPPAGFGKFPTEQVRDVRLAVIGMGKGGAREINYISDVDVMFVAEPRDGSELATARVIEIATRMASKTMHVISDYGVEPGLWEVDANLRPEGKDGALVRTIDSYATYYKRWAENWEFMALLKARPIAGDAELGQQFSDVITPMVWGAAGRDDFVLQVQKMRARVISHIPKDEVDRELKLGPGGLRDVEFTVQLLQLVHGQADESVRVQSTLDALTALAAEGHIGRDDGAEFTNYYRFLRLIEHRVQLRHMQRTHLFPNDPEEQRILGRAVRMQPKDLLEQVATVRRRVRGIHEKVFYRPLLTAVATLPAESYQLTSDQAAARLRAIGYRDPRGALNHIRALISGVSRRSTMMKHLLPVLLEWFTEGANPDQGLLAFRKLSEQLGDASWYLRLLRDSNLAARRLCDILSSSEFCATFLELFPEAVIWLDGEEQLRPSSVEALEREIGGALSRYRDEVALGRVIRGVRRREVLRLAIGGVIGLTDMRGLAKGLTDISTVTIRSAEKAIRIIDEDVDYPSFGVIGMGRFGGAELGFGSDLDVLYVFDPGERPADEASTLARKLVQRIGTILDDNRMPIDLDAGLRPEGKSGPLARSLSAYDAYYSKWSLSWEAQALLRASRVAGDDDLLDRFMEIADRTRYRSRGLEPSELTEIRRLKARMESERLPRGADPKRHLKLGRGSLSDVEWLVQVLQLDHAHDIPDLRTTSTLTALEAAQQHGLVGDEDAAILEHAWTLATRIRSAVYLYSNAQTDVLPGDPEALDGVARLLGYEAGHGVELENDYLTATRRSRSVFETLFYGDE